MNKTEVHLHTQIERGLSKRPPRRLLERAVRVALKSSQIDRAVNLTIVITGDDRIRELNRLYRCVDAPTDVLSFGNLAGEPRVPGADSFYLGDVVISYVRAREQAARFGHEVDEEIALLVVHGVLHLLGYDHEEAEDKRRMWRVQDAALDTLGIDWRP